MQTIESKFCMGHISFNRYLNFSNGNIPHAPLFGGETKKGEMVLWQMFVAVVVKRYHF